MTAIEKFDLSGRVAIITGGAGLLGRKHAEAVIEANGIAILADVSKDALKDAEMELQKKYPTSKMEGIILDITSRDQVEAAGEYIIKKYGRIDILINNAANNPKVEGNAKNMGTIRFENFPMDMWDEDLRVGLTGACICTQVFGEVMAKAGSGVILNIASDLGIIAPDQRIYRKEGLKNEEQPVKPVTYSVIKHGLIGLSKYTATYWATQGVRANTLCPAGVYNGQNEEFMNKLVNLIPLGRMANKEDYKSTILYLISDASSYMTGSTVIIDGGRTCW